MSTPSTRKVWLLANKATGEINLSGGDKATFKLEEQPIPEKLGENQLVVKVWFLSNDPAQRGWIDANLKPERMYRAPVEVGTVMHASGVGEVIESTSDKFRKGQVVTGGMGWTNYAVLKGDTPGLRVVDQLPGGLEYSHYLGALGLTGLTAYYGLVEVAGMKKGESVLVSGAAGATGSMVVQIAKNIQGASRVVGIAGSDEKCRWVESLGADKCLNYKSPNFEKELAAAKGDGFDVYFDNVGGEILDMSLLQLKRHGRVAACGAISGYNSGNGVHLKNYFNVISMRLRIEGFIVLDYMPKAGEALGIFQKALKDGSLKLSGDNETVVDTKFEDVPKTWLKLFEGSNTGKLITKLN